ncbi:hypothetical protein B296_00039094 [Ensete ventricosum]|uniref:Protein kinase domain-containing protein n=1 Tax=Ensete ventricosum TaxID=4639 RepID=A0A426XHQ5_ENSVE|nr:hypothetical protein B296_00039094 [Ensete ventricosum]
MYRAAQTPARPLKLDELKAMEEKPVGVDGHRFTDEELKNITNDFGRVLGKGGFGTVYYGRLPDGTEVAVKISSRYTTGEAMAWSSVSQTSDSVMAGTKEYHNTLQLTEKSDVYSFGIVLLELVTGLPPVLRSPESGHIVPWVRQKLTKADIGEVVDSKLEGQYDINSVVKVIDVAMSCTNREGSKRPTMSEVVMQLKESLQVEASQVRGNSNGDSVVGGVLNDSLEMARLDVTNIMIGPMAR